MIKTFNIAQTRNKKKSIQNHCTPIRNFAARIWKEKVAYASRNFTHTGTNSSSPTSNDDKDIPFSTTCEMSGT